jgi:hypothetical protein
MDNAFDYGTSDTGSITGAGLIFFFHFFGYTWFNLYLKKNGGDF